MMKGKIVSPLFPFPLFPPLKEFAVWFDPLTVNGTMREDTYVFFLYSMSITIHIADDIHTYTCCISIDNEAETVGTFYFHIVILVYSIFHG